MSTQDYVQQLDRLIRSRYPVIEIVSHEEPRVMAFILAIAKTRKRHMVATWSTTNGFSFYTLGRAENGSDAWQKSDTFTLPNKQVVQGKQMTGANAALAFVANFQHDPKQPTMFVMNDLHHFLGRDPQSVRMIREIAFSYAESFDTMIMISPFMSIPADLEKNVTVIDWPLPDETELREILARSERSLPKSVPQRLNGDRDAFIRALSGLTALEAGQAILNSIAQAGELSEKCIPYLVKEKKQIVLKSNLEYFEPVDISELGGMENLKEYMRITKRAYSAEARAAGIDLPRGILLIGPPGTGKSLTAKVAASVLGVMLLRLDVGSLKGGIVGQSEANLGSALKVVDAVGDCVLWIDEPDKGLGDKNGELDGGTSGNMFAKILTWMQERKGGAYVIGAANKFENLRPEFVRRFDDVFVVDLPDANARQDVLRVHMEKRGYSLKFFNADQLVELVNLLWGFSPAEIEKVVKTALRLAFSHNREPNFSDFRTAAESTTPVSRTKEGDISGITRRAGAPLEDAPGIIANVAFTLETDV